MDPAFYREEPFDYNENQRKLNPGLRLEPEKLERAKKAENKREEMGFWGVFGLEVERMKKELELLEAERELLKMPVGVGRNDNEGNEGFLKEYPLFVKENEDLFLKEKEERLIKGNEESGCFLKENSIDIKENPPYIEDNEENKINIKENPVYRASIKGSLFGQGPFALKNIPKEIYGDSEVFLEFLKGKKPIEKSFLKGKKLVFSLEINENRLLNENLIRNILLIAPKTSKLTINEEKRVILIEIEGNNPLNKELESLLIELL